jgi:hypothetical protein
MAALAAAFVSNLAIILYLGPVGACVIITQWPVFMSTATKQRLTKARAGVTQRTNIPAKINLRMVTSFGFSIDPMLAQRMHSQPSDENAGWL